MSDGTLDRPPQEDRPASPTPAPNNGVTAGGPVDTAALIQPVLTAPPNVLARWMDRARTIRQQPMQVESAVHSISAVLLTLLVWWFLTRGEPGERILSPLTLPSPADTLRSFPSLWFEKELSLSILTSLARVFGGFLVAAAIGVPLGVIAGCYRRLDALLRPFSIFGRNIPIAALIPLTMMWFGLGEMQKVAFIFLASVSFVLSNSTLAALAVPDRYLDTAYTLGAHQTPDKGGRLSGFIALGYALVASIGWFALKADVDPAHTWLVELGTVGFWGRFAGGAALGFGLWYPILSHQALRKVVLPLAMPDIANSLRLLFGLAFGYIMLAEVINAGRGLGYIINQSQRRGPNEHIYLCLIIISLLAWGIDRLFLRLQRVAFPYLKNAES